MTALPPHLAPWAPLLAGMRPSFQAALGDYLQRLTLAFGPMTVPQLDAIGEPDGFEGLSRKGSYERLLTSEWLLADEAPDEFLRRAASGEHGFLALRQRDPRASKSCAVLLDGGPDQLGAPRLCQLAVLILMARRAEVAGAELRWGLLQDTRLLIHPVSPATMGTFLGARAVRDPDVDDLARWEWLTHMQPGPDELWLVGGPMSHLPPHGRSFGRVVITEPTSREGRCLRVSVAPAHAAPREVELMRPPEPIEVMLLRDPYASEDRATASVNHHGRPPLELRRDTPLLITPNGRRLGMVEPDGVWRFRYLPTEQSKSRHDWTFTPERTPIAIGISSRSLIWAELDGDTLVLRGRYGSDPVVTAPRQIAIAKESAAAAALPLDGRPPPLVRLGPDSVIIATAHGLWGHDGDSERWWARGTILATRIEPNWATWFVRDAAGVTRQWYRTNNHEVTSFEVSVPAFATRVFVSAMGIRGWQTASGEIELDSAGKRTLVPLHGETAVGFLGGVSARQPVPLVVTDPNKASLAIVGDGERVALPTSGSPLLQVALSLAEPVVAWLTVDGDLSVWRRGAAERVWHYKAVLK